MSDHNEYLKQVEPYLADLEVIQKSKILNEIHQEIAEKNISELDSPLNLANEKRKQHDLATFKEQKRSSILKYFFRFTIAMTLIFVGFMSFLVWKFTPIIKVDEQSNRIIILGGLIDINGASGKLKIFDNYHFSHENFNNDFQASINLDQQKDDIVLKFKSGSFHLKTSQTDQLILDCKFSNPPGANLISEADDLTEIDLRKIEGLNCAISVPIDKNFTIEGEDASISAVSPEYNLYIDLINAKVQMTPELEIDYKYELNIKDESGYIGSFTTSDTPEAYEIRINLDSGAIIRK